MKAVKTFVFVTACFFSSAIYGQSAAETASEKAILFADSLLKSFYRNNFEQYTNLSYPGVISYYGGKKNFREYVQRARSVDNITSPENLKVVQIINNTNEWQCVVQKTQLAMIDGKKAKITSYLVGQSKDEGVNWKFFDVAYNSVDNIVYIMPDIFETLSIPQRQVIYEKNKPSGDM